MTQNPNGLRVINAQAFVLEICNCCFVCGNLKYCQFKYNNIIYRICAKCLKTKPIKKFFSTIGDKR